MCFTVSVGIFFFHCFQTIFHGIQTLENGFKSAVILGTSQNTNTAYGALNTKNKVCGPYFIHAAFVILMIAFYKCC